MSLHSSPSIAPQKPRTLLGCCYKTWEEGCKFFHGIVYYTSKG